MYGTIILSAATVVVKIFGFVYKIPIQNLLGPTASGYFTAAYDVFTTVFVLSTAGLPVAVTKLVSEAQAVGNERQASRTLRMSLMLFLGLGLVGALSLILGADLIAAQSHNPSIAPAVRVVGSSLIFISLTSAFRGYHQGHSDMTPTAVSQTVEAGIKAVAGLILTYTAARMAAPDSMKAAAAMGGVTLGAVAALGYMLLVTRRRRAADRRERTTVTRAPLQPVLGRLVGIAIPATLSATAINLANLIDMMTINVRLTGGAGFSSDQAEYYFGAYSFARTLFGVAPAFMMAMAVSIVPAVATMRARKNREGEIRTMESGLRIIGLLALPASAGLFFLAWPILNLLYGQYGEAVNIAAPLLQTLGIATFFTCTVSVTNAMLQARGQLFLPVLTMLMGAIVKLAVSMSLVGMPDINIMGAPIGTLACYFLIALLNMLVLARLTGAWARFFSVFLRPLAAAVVMGVITKGLYLLGVKLLTGPFGEPKAVKLAAVAAILLGVLCYGALVILFKAITREDLELLPKGGKIATFLKI